MLVTTNSTQDNNFENLIQHKMSIWNFIVCPYPIMFPKTNQSGNYLLESHKHQMNYLPQQFKEILAFIVFYDDNYSGN